MLVFILASLRLIQALVLKISPNFKGISIVLPYSFILLIFCST
ncbi:hypothetical protein HPHPH11_1647 [Helicobacter pylori Hp H-11]|nr:hypothetical protein HPHPH11_1647 [Helicobacter pylori Hp H-11]